MLYLLADKYIFKWRLEAQPCYTFKIKPPQANLDTTGDVPKKKVLTATEPVLPSSSKKWRVYAIAFGISRVFCTICSLLEICYLKTFSTIDWPSSDTPGVLQVSAHHWVSPLLVYAIVNFYDKMYIVSNNVYTLRCCG